MKNNHLDSVKRIFYLLLFLVVTVEMQAQSLPLANQYMEEGEYDKAASIFSQLYQRNPGNEYYLTSLINCYSKAGTPEKSLVILEQFIHNDPGNTMTYVTYAAQLRNAGKTSEVQGVLDKILPNLPPNRSTIIRTFYALNKEFPDSDLAEKVLLKGEKIMGEGTFSIELANYYAATGKRDQMLIFYLDVLKKDPLQYNYITSYIQRSFTDVEEYNELQAEIYKKLQDDPGNPQLVQLLAWTFMQKKDYKSALRQFKALAAVDDNASLFNIMQMAGIAKNEHEYPVALDGYKYIIDLGQSSAFYPSAYMNYLQVLVDSKVKMATINDIDAREIDSVFTLFLDANAHSAKVHKAMLIYADYLVRYRDKLSLAIQTLDDYLKTPGLNPRDQAEVKLALGDYLVMNGKRWDASLLYSQVDKDFKEDPIGQEGRYKNALLSYYFGDFEWAQTQFDVLKNATSRLIANDAIDHSVFIMDNTGLDTTDAALRLYTAAELLIYRNLFDQANQKLDSILTLYPGNSLDDDVLYARAHIYVKQKQWDKAIAAYTKVINDYKDQIRADNSLYELAKLYDDVLDRKSEAQALYEKLFNDYPGSILAQEARLRYRALRGDTIQ